MQTPNTTIRDVIEYLKTMNADAPAEFSVELSLDGHSGYSITKMVVREPITIHDQSPL